MARAKTKTPAQLREYERKRDFGKTAEPAPRKRRAKRGAPRFVVQEHSARRLHWDLRLEHDGVAASWAIPNGIPDDPAENRKAIHTEDHPLEYLEFEGEIPAGEYGAGTMKIWDRGTYQLEKWEPGKVMLSFEGERLSGRYALFRAGKADKDWMIHRIDPPARERDPFPEQVPPMLARPGRLPRRRDGWAAELLWRGERALAFCQPGRLRLQGADLTDVTEKAPKVRRLTRQLGSRDAVLDGELVALEGTELTYVIFDLLYLEGSDLCAEPYERRRELLDGLELEGEGWQTPAYSTGDAKALLEASRERGLAGLVLKRLDSPYEPGRRSRSWVEIANAPSRRDESRSNRDQLDPGAPADVLDCAQVAVWIRGMFDQLGLDCYPKTSGSKGMQVYAPLDRETTYERTKPFAEAVARTLEAKFPDRVVSRMAKNLRPGKVLVDWSQNDEHKTTVCVYSLRAKARPTVSTPLEWEEVEAALQAGRAERLVFDHAEVLKRVEEKGDLFAPLLTQRQALP
ncbi:MAG: bifunctional non-ous end joining protein LigD [Solirubrobacterales bacterium]|jgi:bifunctional non-homologous end joining protein LigD|nr:bifunctional non-ous end joining protein LigD [Solirubrobacterales bacterium]